jgi:hypothetical protein
MGCSRELKGRHKEGCRYASKCKFIYAHKKHMAFPVPIFNKLTNVAQHYGRYLITYFTQIKN